MSAQPELVSETEKKSLVTKQILGSDFLQSLHKFFKAVEIHDRTNQIYEKIFVEVHRTASDWLKSTEFETLDLSLKGDQFFLNDKRIRPRPKIIKKLKYILQTFRKKQIFGFAFPQGQTKEQLSEFLWVLHEVKRGDTVSSIGSTLKSRGLSDYSVKTLAYVSQGDAATNQSVVDSVYHQLFKFIQALTQNFDAVTQSKEIPPIEQLLFELNGASEEDLIAFFCQNPLTQSEFPNVQVAVNSAICLHAWGKALGLPPGVVVELAGCGLAHPIASINQAPGFIKLDPVGFDRGSLLFSNLQRLKNLWQLTELQSLSLFEFVIPFGQNGVYEIHGKKCYQHFFSRMLRIVVLFQQMICLDRRRPQLSPQQAVDKLLTENLGCDRSLVKLFVSWIGIFPLGSFVKLNTGEIGQVCSTSTDISGVSRPVVSIYKDKDGNALAKPEIVNLGAVNDRNGIYLKGIQSSVKFEEAGVPLTSIQHLSEALALSTSN